MYKYITIFIIALFSLAFGGILVRASGLPPVSSAFYRCVLALPLIFLWMLKDQHGQSVSHIKKTDMIALMGAGVFLALDLILWHHAFFLTTIANANLLANLVPFILIPLSIIFFKTRLNKWHIVSFFIVTVGFLLLAYGKAQISKENIKGDMLAILTAVFYALYLFSIMRFRLKYGASIIMFFSTIGCAVFLLIFGLVTDVSFSIPSLSILIMLIILAITSQIIGQGGMAICLGHLPPLFSSTLILLQPVIAAIYAFIIFNERLSFMEISGMIVIIAGIAVAKRIS